MYQYREQYKTNTKHTSPCLDLCVCQLLVHYKENTTTTTISMLKRDRKTPRSIQIRLKVQCNCCKLTSPILRVAGSMPAAGSNHIWPVNLSEHSYSSI